MNFEVMLDVFSGRPNPTWNLTGRFGEELAKRLRHLPSAGKQKAPSPPDLGYRGLRVTQKGQSREDIWQGPYEVYGGFVRHGDLIFVDEGRSLERWLLTEGGPNVERELRNEILREMGR
jgi:hypothetical protein